MSELRDGPINGLRCEGTRSRSKSGQEARKRGFLWNPGCLITLRSDVHAPLSSLQLYVSTSEVYKRLVPRESEISFNSLAAFCKNWQVVFLLPFRSTLYSLLPKCPFR